MPTKGVGWVVGDFRLLARLNVSVVPSLFAWWVKFGEICSSWLCVVR